MDTRATGNRGIPVKTLLADEDYDADWYQVHWLSVSPLYSPKGNPKGADLA